MSAPLRLPPGTVVGPNLYIPSHVRYGVPPPVPDPITFAISPEYLHRPLYPRQGTMLKTIFLRTDLLTDYDHQVIREWEDSFTATGNNGAVPGLIERMERLRNEGYRWFREILLVMGRRAGKGYISALAMAYVLWHYLAKHDPQAYYGIDRDKRLECLIYAGRKDQARDHLWRDLYNMISGGVCFQPYLSKPMGESLSIYAPADLAKRETLTRKGIFSGLDLATFRIIPLPATPMSGRGGAGFMLGLDEMGHMVATGANRSSEEVWVAATPSLDQFGKDAFIVAPSSPWEMIGQFYVEWQHAQERDEVTGEFSYPEIFMLQLPSWAPYYDWERAHELDLFPEGFTGDLDEYVETGPPRLDPLKKAVQDYDEQMRRLEKADPDMFAVERLAHWQSALDAYLDPRKIAAMFERGAERGLAMRTDGILALYYKGHADPSFANDNFGVAVGHCEKNDEGFDTVVFDYISHWNPADWADHTIDYTVINEELWKLIKGFPIDDFTFDQYNCLSAGSRVATGRGLIKVEDLVDPAQKLLPGQTVELSEQVLTRDGNAMAKVGYRRGEVATIVATTKPGYRIEATAEHRVLVRPKKARSWHSYPASEWRTMGDLRVGDQLLVRRGSLVSVEPLDITHLVPDESDRGVQPLRSGLYAAYDWSAEEYRTVRLGLFETAAAAAECAAEYRRRHPISQGVRQWPEKLTSELAELLGLLASDGHVSTKLAEFSNDDPEIRARFHELTSMLFGYRWNESAGSSPTNRRISNGSTRLIRFLTGLGAGGRSQDKIFPEMIFRSPSDVMRGYLRGLFDGDGRVSIGSDLHVAFGSTSRSLARGVHLALLSVGIYSTFWEGNYTYRGETRKHWRIKIFGEDALTYREKIGFGSSRMREKLDRLVEIVQQSETGRRANRSWDSVDGRWFTITALDESRAECYDLTVPGEENFVADGIVAHNSQYFVANFSKLARSGNIPKRINIGIVPSTAPYNFAVAENFKIALNQGWVTAPYYEQADLELRFLQLKGGKVTHQTAGPVQHDDVARCMMEVTYDLLNVQVSNFLMKGAPMVANLAGGTTPWMQKTDAHDLDVIGQFSQTRRGRTGIGPSSPTRGRPGYMTGHGPIPRTPGRLPGYRGR